MAERRLSGKLAVILHADIAGSTALVQQDERLAHERIQDAFRRFSETIQKYQGRSLECQSACKSIHPSASKTDQVNLTSFSLFS